MEHESLLRASLLQKQAEETEHNLEIIEKEIQELQKLDSSLEFLMKSRENSTISSLGKGIHVKTLIEVKELYVEAGAGVVVKKKPDEARQIIHNQIKKLVEARLHLLGQLEIYYKTIDSLMSEIGHSGNVGEKPKN